MESSCRVATWSCKDDETWRFWHVLFSSCFFISPPISLCRTLFVLTTARLTCSCMLKVAGSRGCILDALLYRRRWWSNGMFVIQLLGTQLLDHWLVVWNISFPFSWEYHHPNWRTPSFFRELKHVETTNQTIMHSMPKTCSDLDLVASLGVLYQLLRVGVNRPALRCSRKHSSNYKNLATDTKGVHWYMFGNYPIFGSMQSNVAAVSLY